MEEKNRILIGSIGLALLIIFIVSLAVLVGYIGISNMLGRETKYIEGIITSYEIIQESNTFGGTRDYIILTFDNNESYKIVLSEDSYDFTVNSKLVLRITKGGQERSWSIDKIIKVPDEE